MDILSFCLGAASALTLALLVVIVVAIVRLNGKLSRKSDNLRAVEHSIEELDRRIGDEVQGLNNSIEQNRVDARSYTDSRIDKVLDKKE